MYKRQAQEHPEISVCKVNIDEEPELAEKFQIMGIPALVLFKDGEVVSESVGVRPKNHIEQMIMSR